MPPSRGREGEPDPGTDETEHRIVSIGRDVANGSLRYRFDEPSAAVVDPRGFTACYANATAASPPADPSTGRSSVPAWSRREGTIARTRSIPSTSRPRSPSSGRRCRPVRAATAVGRSSTGAGRRRGGRPDAVRRTVVGDSPGPGVSTSRGSVTVRSRARPADRSRWPRTAGGRPVYWGTSPRR